MVWVSLSEKELEHWSVIASWTSIVVVDVCREEAWGIDMIFGESLASKINSLNNYRRS